MFQTKDVEKIEIQILHSLAFSENHAVYMITWKNMVGPDRPQGKCGTYVYVLHAA